MSKISPVAAARKLFIAASLVIAAPAAATSFDCASAAARVEKLICDYSELSRLDEVLAEDFQAALSHYEYPESEQFRRQQRAWLSRRNACQEPACIRQAYIARIEEMRRAYCARVAEAACPYTDSKFLPRSADGRLLLLSSEHCRSPEEIQLQADCIEAGLSDPCNYMWMFEMCPWPHVEVAERRIRKAQQSAIESARKWKDAAQGLPNEVRSSERRWQEERKGFCEEQQRLSLTAPATDDEERERRLAGETNFGERLPSCMRRVTEQRTKDIELFADAMRGTTSSTELDRFLAYLRAKPRLAPLPSH